MKSNKYARGCREKPKDKRYLCRDYNTCPSREQCNGYGIVNHSSPGKRQERFECFSYIPGTIQNVEKETNIAERSLIEFLNSPSKLDNL